MPLTPREPGSLAIKAVGISLDAAGPPAKQGAMSAYSVATLRVGSGRVCSHSILKTLQGLVVGLSYWQFLMTYVGGSKISKQVSMPSEEVTEAR